MHDGHFTILAQRDSYRYVALCEHGTIHLIWGNVTLRWRPDDFAEVVCLLDKGVDSARGTKIGEGHNCLIHVSQGFFQLVLGSAALFLAPEDFLLLVDMARMALHQLIGRLADDAITQPAKTDGDIPKARNIPGVSFSVN